MTLVYKHEKPLFTLLAILAGLFWLVLVGATFGIALLYILLGYVAFLFAHSAFISYLKGNGVRITPDHYPDLYAQLVKACERVGVSDIPEAYILRADVFNALATRFLGRHFVVLFSDVLDALEDRPGAVEFYIGHELGHIHRGHLKWSGFLMPAMLLPLIGCAYRRAEEYTCDRYGSACCDDEADAVAAMATIAAGNTRWPAFRPDQYLKQREDSAGFWMSFNELISDYPWLTKRMAAVLAFRQDRPVEQPRRHWFAWVLAFFIPRFGGGSGAFSLLITIAMIGVLAAIAVPAYQEYIHVARTTAAYTAAQPLQTEVATFAMENNAWPTDFTQLGHDSELIAGPQGNYEIGLYDNGTIGVEIGQDETGTERYLVLSPQVEEGNISWQCHGQNVPVKWLPAACKQ